MIVASKSTTQFKKGEKVTFLSFGARKFGVVLADNAGENIVCLRQRGVRRETWVNVTRLQRT